MVERIVVDVSVIWHSIIILIIVIVIVPIVVVVVVVIPIVVVVIIPIVIVVIVIIVPVVVVVIVVVVPIIVVVSKLATPPLDGLSINVSLTPTVFGHVSCSFTIEAAFSYRKTSSSNLIIVGCILVWLI